MKEYKEIEQLKGVQCKNKRGEWVSAIPEPYYAFWVYTCECGRGFWSDESYRAHYALKHVLGM